METIRKTIDVDVPVRTAYNQWTQFEEFPEFMEGVGEVVQIDDTHLHWVAEIGGVRREWNATITEQVPDQVIAWTAETGKGPDGSVSYAPAGTGTRIALEMRFEPEGLAEKAGDSLGIIERRVEGDLERFKEMIESRGTESGAWRGTVEQP